MHVRVFGGGAEASESSALMCHLGRGVGWGEGGRGGGGGGGGFYAGEIKVLCEECWGVISPGLAAAAAAATAAAWKLESLALGRRSSCTVRAGGGHSESTAKCCKHMEFLYF